MIENSLENEPNKLNSTRENFESPYADLKIYNKSLDKNQLKIDSQINLNSSNVIFTTDEILIIILIFILFLIFIAVIRYFIYKKKNQDRRRRRIINARFSSSNCDKIFFVSQL